MGKDTEISWAHHTLNLWWGCTKIANNPCCDNCYAATFAKRVGSDIWGARKPRRAIASAWKNLENFNRIGEKAQTPQRVFCASMGDIFERERPLVDNKGNPMEGTTGNLRKRLFNEISDGRYPWIIFMMLTKRPQNVRRMVPEGWLTNWPENVWLGVSVGDQANWDRLIPHLLRLPVPTPFVSMEPLLGAVDFRNKIMDGKSWGAIGGQICHNCGGFCWYESDGQLCPWCGNPSRTTHRQIKWVIAGGESGNKARPTRLDDMRAIRNQCIDAGVPFHFKQWGEWKPLQQFTTGELMQLNHSIPAHDFLANPLEDTSVKIGKHAAGRLLDGREWNEFPQTPA